MVEGGGALPLVQEALAIGFAGGVLGALDGDKAAEGGVARAIDLAHAASAEARLDVKTAGENAVRLRGTARRQGSSHGSSGAESGIQLVSPGGGLHRRTSVTAGKVGSEAQLF